MRIVTGLLFCLVLSAPLFCQTANLSDTVPGQSFVGESFCFDLTWTNSGSPGYGPYIRLIMPPELTFDSATFLGSGVSVTNVGVFPPSPGNQLIDPVTSTPVSGLDGATLLLLTYPVGSVVAGQPELVIEVCATISTAATVGVPLPITYQPIYRFGDTPTGTNGPILGMPATATVTPTLFTVSKTNNAPESERPPGPSWPFTYTLAVDIANGQTLDNIQITDLLPANVQFVGPVVATAGCVVSTTPSTLTPGGSLVVDCASVVGVTGNNDITVSFPVHFIDILNETNCGTLDILNGTTVTAEFMGAPQGPVMDDTTITAKHLALQKGAAPAMVIPGDMVTYTLNFQVTDFGDADSYTIVDTLPDGLTFAAHSGMTVNGGPVAILPTILVNLDGTTTLTYAVTAVTGTLTRSTGGTITYTATVDQDYTPAPDPILAGDPLTSGVTSTYTLAQGATGCVEGSAAGIQVIPLAVVKSIVNPLVEYVPGDILTFRLTLTIPSGDTEDIVFEDFFPLPVFDVTTINTTFGVDIRLAPTDTLGLSPTSITVNAATNGLRIDWPNVVTTSPQVLAVDVDVQIQDDPFADGLFLTNLLRVTTEDSANNAVNSVQPTQLLVRAPDLTIVKGVAASDNAIADATISPSPAIFPVDGNISNSDAGDTLTFNITLQNMGGAAAFDVLINDPPVAGFTSCTLVSVEDGDGNPLPSSGDLFAGGLTLTNAITGNDNAAGGTDVVVITYTCQLDGTVIPRGMLTNTATATWASGSGAVTFDPISDEATTSIASPTIAKAIDSVSPSAAGAAGVTSGDLVTYLLTVTLPEGTTPGLVLVDTLPAGFDFVSAAVDTTGFGGTVTAAPIIADGGATVTLTFGSTTVTGDNNPANNSFSVTLVARVDGSDGANAAPISSQSKTNTIALDWTGNPGAAVMDSVTTQFVEPILDITKTMAPDTNIDAGDLITITFLVRNTGTGPAYDIVLSDTLNDGGTLFDLATVAAGLIPAGFAFNYTNPTVTISQNPGMSLAAGGSVSFTLTANVQANAVTGSVFSNTADVTGDSQDGMVADERQTNDSGSDTVSTRGTAAGKSIIATSESWTPDTGTIVLAIGEIATYQLVFDIPEGLTQSSLVTPIIVDALPTGLAYQTGTATIRAVSDTSISAASLPGGLTPIPAAATAITPVINGQILEFDLGDITNSDDDANIEQIIITYNALVLNTSNNNRNNNKTNTTTFSYLNRDGNPQSTTASQSYRIGEPALATSKSANPSTVVGGTLVTFTVVITNQNLTRSTPGWEITLEDMLPARYQTPALTSATLSRGAIDVTACAGFTGNTLNFDMTCLAASERYLAPNETITLVYTATVDPTINFEEQVQNFARAEGTSLPGSNGTGGVAPGAAGSSTGERTGSGVNNELGENVNDLTSTGNATVTASRPTVSKTGDTSLQIGATALMTLTIAVPVGTTNNFVMTDDLPTGLRYTGTPITITTPAMNFSSTNSPGSTPGAGTDPLVFDFGMVTNSAAVPQSITIEYEVQVENILTNQNTVSLQNTATLSYAGATMPLPADSATITVVEPNLTIAKSITNGAAGSDAGDTISYQTTLTNTSAAATAFAVDFSDLLPAGLLGAPDGSGSGPFFLNIAITNPGNAIVLNGDGLTPLTSADAGFATTLTVDDTLVFPPFDLPPSSTLTITYDAVLANDVSAGEMLVNNVDADYNSLADGTGRDNSDMGDDDNDAVLNNYGESASATLTVNSALAIQKSLSSGQSATVTIGDEVLYDLRVDVIEGMKDSVVVTDVLPAGFGFIELVTIEADPNISYGGPGMAVEAPAGTITIDLGLITNPADGDDTNDFLVLRLRVQVEDVPANSNGAMQTNSASVISATNSAGPATIDVTIVEPNLEILKVPSDPNPSLGDEVTFTITVRHQMSTADAYDVVLSDLIPAGLTYVPGSTTGDGMVNETDPNQPIFDLGTITLAEMQKVFSFRVTVDLDTAVGQTITNTIQATYDGQSGSPTIERIYNASGDGMVTPSVPAFVDAEKTVVIAVDGGVAGEANPGDTLEYTIILTNLGADVTNLVFTDRVPTNTTYVPASLSSSTGTVDDSLAPDLSVSAPGLLNGASITISFQVTIDGGTANGTIIRNQGSVDTDQTVPEPTDVDGIDENGDQPTDIPVGTPPDLTNALYVQKVVSWIDDADLSADVTPGDRLRYALIFSNLGDEVLTNVTLSDTIPTGLTYVGGSASANTSVLGANVSVSIAAIPIGGRATASFDVTIDAPLFDSDASPNVETFINQGSATSDQTDPIATDENGNPSDGYQPTSITAVDGVTGSPLLDLEKRWALAIDNNGDGLVNPGDTIQYTITLTNIGSAPALNARLSDMIPADTTLVPGSVASSSGAVVTENPVNVNIGTVDPGGLVTITFRVTVNGGTPDGTIIPNQATVTGDNFAPTPSDDNGNDGDGLNPTLTPVVAGGGGGAGTPTGLLKSIVATSEAGSTNPEVLIGEVITYRVQFTVPAGTTREVFITDSLPPGLTYLPGSAQLARVFETGLNASQNPGGVNSTATGVFVALTDGVDFENTAGDLSLFLGDIINSDNDANAELYLLEYRVIVANIPANQAGISLNNLAGISYHDQLGQPQQLTPVSQSVTVIEADLLISKTPAPSLILNSGGDVTFTFTLTNPAGANIGPAYNARLVDLLPAEWTALSVDSITPSGGVNGLIDNSSGTTLDIAIGEFPPDGQLVVVITATAAGPLASGSIVNNANLTWTSLPGSNGTGSATPGAPGASDGERTGAGGSPNDLIVSDSATVNVGMVGLSKAITAPQARYAIGDTVTYSLDIALPPLAVLTNSTLQDVLDAGLSYTTGSLSVNLPGAVNATNSPADFTVTPDAPAMGQETLAYGFGTLTNTANSIQTITIAYSALITNILSNQNNQGLTNNVSLTFDDPGGGMPIQLIDSANLLVGEPNLSLAKSILSSPVGLDAGDTVQFQVVIGNNGTRTSFETLVSDTLPAGFESATNFSIMATGGAQTPSINNNGSDWNTSPFDLPVGDTVTIAFEVTISVSVIPGQAIQNSVQATFTSRDGTDPNERDGSDAGSNQADDSDLNNYNANGNAPVIFIADPVALNKAFFPDAANATYTIGEVAFYRLTIFLIEGTTSDLVLTDVLPDGVQLLSTSVSNGNLGMTSGYTPPPAIAGQTIDFDFGEVINPANGNGADDFITVDIEVLIDNVPANQNGTILGNHASLTYTGPAGTVLLEFDADAGTPGVQPLDLSVVLPVLNLDKSASPSMVVAPGDVVNFQLVVQHDPMSTADAFDILVIDTLPPGLTYVVGSASLTPVINGSQLIFSIATLSLVKGQIIITYQARVEPDVVLGQPLQNLAVATFTSLAGINPDERTGDDGSGGLNDLVAGPASVILTPNAAALHAEKTDALTGDPGTNGIVNPGDTLTYTVLIENTGNLDATGVTFTDSPDANTALVVGSVTSSQGTVTSGNGAGDGSVAVDIGTIAPMSSVTVTFQVSVNNPLPMGITQVANQGLIGSNELPDLPTDDPDSPDPMDPTLTPVAGDPILTATKADSLAVDADLNGVPSAGDTLEYTVVIANGGAVASDPVVFNDTPGANTALVVGSVTTTQGTITGGNGAGDTSVAIDIGAIGAGAIVTITFRVIIANPLPPLTTQVANQGIVSAGPMAMPTDDPDDPGPSDPTITPLGGSPDLYVSKVSALFSDPDMNSIVSAGDTLEYTVIMVNNGDGDATGLILNDMPDPNSALIVGSVTSTRGSVISGNGAGDTSVSVDIGTLEPTGTVTITFRVLIDNPLAMGVNAIRNQALAVNNGPDVPSDDPNTLTPVDPTVDPLVSGPLLIAIKTVALVDDVNGDGNTSPGDGLRYTVTILNVGDSDAFAIIFDDTPDPNTAILAGSVMTSQGVVLTGNDGVPPISVAVGTLAAGTSAVINFDVRVADPLDPAIRMVSNQGLVSSQNTPVVLTDDPVLPGATDPTVTPIVQADLRVLKSAPVTPIVAGTSFDYTILITNDGPDTATGVTLSDPLPMGLTVTAVTASLGTCTFTGSQVNCVLGTMTVGQSATVVITVSVDDEGPYVNTVSVDANETDPVSDNNVSTAPVGVLPGVDLELVKTVDNNNPDLFGTINFTLTLVNNGPDDATNITVTDTLPAALVLLGATPQTGNYDTGTNTWSIPALAAGAMTQVVLEVRVDQSGMFTNIAEVTAVDQLDIDSTPDNGPGEDDYSEVDIFVDTAVDLVVVKSVDMPAASVGGTLVYTIEVSNLGPDIATGVQVEDVLPPGMNVTGTVASQGSFSPMSLIWLVGTLAPGETATLALSVEVLEQTPGRITNIAIASSLQPELDLSNNSSGVAVTIITAVPTLPQWALIFFIASLAGLGLILNRRRRGTRSFN